MNPSEHQGYQVRISDIIHFLEAVPIGHQVGILLRHLHIPLRMKEEHLVFYLATKELVHIASVAITRRVQTLRCPF